MGKYEQGELLSQIESYSDAEIKPVRPRNIPSPASEKFKQTQVNYSVFGWQFQIVAAIVLSLIYRKKLMKVKVEGKTEDIELYLKNEDPIFIQAKSTTQKMDEFHGEKTPCKGAIETLLNTSNSQANNYSKLIYINNFLNPLKLEDSVKKVYWEPTANELLIKDYDALPSSGKDFLKDRLKEAQDELDKGNYFSDTNNFDWKKFEIITLIMDNNDSNNKFNILHRTIENVLIKVKSQIYSDELSSSFITQYLNNATKKEETIFKEDILWRFIYELVEKTADKYLDDLDLIIQEEVESYSNRFITEQTLNIDIINRVYSDFNLFKEKNNSRELQKFLDEEWEKLKEDFPIDEDMEIQKGCIQDMIWKILKKKRIIDRLKEEFNV